MKKRGVYSILSLFFLLIIVSACSKSPTGNVVIESSDDESYKDKVIEAPSEEVQEVEKPLVIQPKDNAIKDTVIIERNGYVNNMITRTSEEKRLYYKIEAEYPVEFILFPSEIDMINAVEKRNLIYNWYNGCIGVGKKLEGYCDVNEVGFAIKNNDGGRSVRVSYRFELK